MGETGYGAIPPQLESQLEPPGSRRLRWLLVPVVAVLAVAVVATAAVLLASGVGGDDGSEERAAATESSMSAASAAASASAAAEASASASQRAEYDNCKQQVRGLSDAIGQINSRLAIGIDYQEYGDRLGDIRVEYDDVVAASDGLSEPCLEVARPLEDAMNKYVTVLNLWGECIDSYDCDFSEGQTNDKAQRLWRQADKKLARAELRLAELQPD